MHRYKVWDPSTEDSDDATDIVADTPDGAAEAYAESDMTGQRDGIYASLDGHMLHVLDGNDDVWEVRVAVEHAPIAAALKRRLV